MVWLLLVGLAGAEEPMDLEALLVGELEAAQATLAEQEEAPHYIALAVEERHRIDISARWGALNQSRETTDRVLDVEMRVGTPQLDSYHALRGFSSLEGSSRSAVRLPIDDDPYALRHAIAREIDRRYRDEAERIVMVRANLSVKVEEEAIADDFEPRDDAQVDRRDTEPLGLDRDAWASVLVEVSDALRTDPLVHMGSVSLNGLNRIKTFVDSEGTRLVHGSNKARASVALATTAEDGDIVQIYKAKDVHDITRLPDAEELQTWVAEARADLAELAAAPRGEPFSGPVILSGKAAGVFFHEVFGHRVEGHRQKSEFEGKTFAEYVGRPILPSFIDVYDDPTISELEGEQLNGFYHYDDEGVPAARAELVDDGIFVGFLMQRSPIPGFETTNGHGRRMAGRAPKSRMATPSSRRAPRSARRSCDDSSSVRSRNKAWSTATSSRRSRAASR